MQALSVVGLIFLAMQVPLFLMVPPKPTALLGMIDDPVPRPVFLGALGACGPCALVTQIEPKAKDARAAPVSGRQFNDWSPKRAGDLS